MRYFCTLLFCLCQFAYGQNGIIFRDAAEQLPKLGYGAPWPNSFWSGNPGDSNAGRIVLSDSFSRKGSKSYRFELKKVANANDAYNLQAIQLAYNFLPAGTAQAIANDMGQADAFTRNPLNLRWIGMSTLIPAWWQTDTHPESIGFQLRNVPDNYSSPNNLEIIGDRYIMHTILWKNNLPKDSIADLGPVVKAQWEDWLLERNYTNADSGFVRVYRNGKLVAAIYGSNWPAASAGYAKEPYILQGIYKNSWGNAVNGSTTTPIDKRVVYYDEFLFGSAQATLSDMVLDGDKARMIFYDNAEIPGMPFNGFSADHHDPEKWTSFQGDPSVSSVVRSDSVKRRGRYSYRFELKDGPGNTWPYLKSELAWNFLPAGTPAGTLGDYEAYTRKPLGLRWMAASIYIPAHNTDFNTVTSVLFNTKTTGEEWGSPNYLGIYQGRFFLALTGINKAGQKVTKNLDAGPVTKNRWIDWVLNRNFTSADSGYIRLYRDGVLVAEYLGGNWKEGPNNSKEPYVQMGVYKWAFEDGLLPKPDVDRFVMYMDEVRFGYANATLEDFRVSTKANLLPEIVLNPDQTILQPVTKATIFGTVTDKDGSIYAKYWQKISGPTGGNMSDSLQDTVRITNLQVGTYLYRLTVTDNDNGTMYKDVRIYVKADPAKMFLFDTWTTGVAQNPGYVWNGTSTSNSVAMNKKSPVTGDFSIQMTVGLNSEGGFLAIDTDDTLENIYMPGTIWMSVSGHKVLIGDYDKTFKIFTVSQPAQSGDFLRIKRTGSVFKLQWSGDNGTVWKDIFTYVRQTNAKIWIKATFYSAKSAIYYPVLVKYDAVPALSAAGITTQQATDQVIPGVHAVTRCIPNPANQWVKVFPGNDLSAGKINIRLIDLGGKVLSDKQEVFQFVGQAIQVETGQLKNGTYLMIISDRAGHNLSRKILINH